MPKVYYIPNGPLNLSTIFPMVDFSQMAEYYIELVDTADAVVATTTLNQLCGCQDDPDMIRICFLNYLGTMDCMNFKLILKEHESKSDSFQKPTSIPLLKTSHSLNRFNVKSNDTFTAITIEYGEREMEWVDEIFDSPVAWIQWDGSQGQPASFLPIKINDKKTVKQQQDDRFTYQTQIEFTMSNDRFIIRN